jgi:hypothetical protein
MMDSETIQLGDRQTGIMHFWELEPGAIEKPRIREIADANKNIGIIIAYHKIAGPDRYLVSIRLSGDHYTALEARLFEQTYRK